MHRPAEPGDRLRQSIEQGTAVIGIVGMGYVGLPLMLAVTAKDYRVLGFDIDAPKVEGLNRGRSPLKHIGDAAIEKVVAAGRFEATADFRASAKPTSSSSVCPRRWVRTRSRLCRSSPRRQGQLQSACDAVSS